MNAVLLVGPKKNRSNPEKVGGVIILFEDLLRQCESMRIAYEVIDTNKANYKNKLVAYMLIVCAIIAKTPKSTHVSLHGTANDFVLIAPFALAVSKLFRKSFSLRKFAGNFIELFENYSRVKQAVVAWTLRQSTCNFFETKYLVDYFKKYNKHTYWFPNVRAKQRVSTDRSYNKKFIFIGAVSQEKGIEVLCKASKLLGDAYTIDIYGPLYDAYTQEFFEQYRVSYKGSLNSEEVVNTLQQYDILLLPSFREGYPGVIIEALSVGLPVIASNLQGIQEMVSTASSVLVDPGSAEQLKEAMESFNEHNYASKSTAAKQAFEHFDSNIQTARFFQRIGLQRDVV